MLATLNPYTGIYKNKSCNCAICLHHGITFSSASITKIVGLQIELSYDFT